MRVGITSLSYCSDRVDDPKAELIDLVRAVEDLGFAGFWVTDSQGRGRAKLEAMTVLSIAAAVSSRIEIGTCIMQLPLRNPAELANRARTLDILSGRRFRFGVGPGSTRADFDLTGNDFEARHKTFRESLDVMGAIWRGEPRNGAVLAPWPGFEDRPALLLGAWKKDRAIERAARIADGWIASGLGSSWDDLERGIRTYRAAGGRRVVLANVPIDVEGTSEGWPFADHAAISLIGDAATVRQRLKRLEDLGVDDVLVVFREPTRQRLEALRELI